MVGLVSLGRTLPLPLGFHCCRDLLHGQQDQARLTAFPGDPAGIEQEHFMPDGREVVLHAEIFEGGALLQDFLQELPQGRGFPTAVGRSRRSSRPSVSAGVTWKM